LVVQNPFSILVGN